mgnify:CR=1 FL=1
MTGLGRKGLAAALCALISYTGGVFAQAKMPQREFVCQVEDADAVTRFIGIQAATLEAAQDIAQGKSKWPVPAGRVLIECIDPRAETFKSGQAQKAYTEEVR